MTARVSSPVHVGRTTELAAIVRALEGVAAGDPVHVLVGGEAGIGKTRLTAEAMRLAGERSIRTLRGECANVGGSSLPYAPFVDMLRGLAGTLAPDELATLAGPFGNDLARLVPAWGTDGPPVPTQSEWMQARLFEGLLGLLERLARRAPLLIVVEDLHWADPATRETIAYLVRALRGVPALLLGTFRSDELHRRHPLLPWLAEMERGAPVNRMELARLGRPEVADQLGAILGAAPSDVLVDEIFARSDGNPFFAEELLAAATGSAGRRLPPTLREILLAHIASAPESVGPVLAAAAVAGERADHDVLARAVGLDEDDLIVLLRVAVGAHLLVVEQPTVGRERYAFRHSLVREVVLDELLPGERRRLHRAIAETLEAMLPPAADDAAAAAVARTGTPNDGDAGRWAELAYHWAGARDDRKAFLASLRAADAAVSSFAFRAAVAEYERVLETWDALADAAEIAALDRVEVRRRAGRAAYLAADFRRSIAHLRAALAEVDATTHPLRAGMLLEELARSLYVAGDAQGSLVAYREAMDTIPVRPPTPERARAVSGLGQILMLQNRFADSVTACEEAIRIARAVGARGQEGHALNTLGRDLVGLGRCEPGLAAMREALAIALDERDADDIGRAYVNLADGLDECGLTAEALVVTDEGIAAADALGISHSYGHYILSGGVAYATTLGRWTEARRMASDAAARSPDAAAGGLYLMAHSLALLVGSGDRAAADAALAIVGELSDPAGDQYTAALHAAAAEHELWRSAPEAALAIVERALPVLGVTGDRASAAEVCRVGAWAAADVGELGAARREVATVDAARAGLGAIREHLEGMEAQPAGDGVARILRLVRATIDAEAGRLERRSDTVRWAAVADGWDAAERPVVAAYARWRQGEAALAAGDRANAAGQRAAAAVALRAAHAVADAVGARPLGAAIDAVARRGRIDLRAPSPTDPMPAAPPAHPFGLTRREREVLALVADGRTNRQVAEALFISESTAGVHVSNILGKLEVATRGEAAAVAFRLGLAAPVAPGPGSDPPPPAAALRPRIGSDAT